ncbi:hypothetical protein V8B97DRAFT_2005757 [Scleroderma yunnanense]
MDGHCPPPLVDLSSPPATTSASDGGLNHSTIWSLHGPGLPGTPLPDNPIPASCLWDLVYVCTAATMADSLTAVTGNSHAEWSRFFMAVKQDPTSHRIHNATATLSPIPNQAFIPVVASPALHYYLAGKQDVPQDSPLYPYWCYKCNRISHWSWEHDSNRPYWEPGMARNNRSTPGLSTPGHQETT